MTNKLGTRAKGFVLTLEEYDKLKKITVLSESRVSTSGNEYFAYDIAQEVTDSVDKQQSDDLTILVPQATETVPAHTDADLPADLPF